MNKFESWADIETCLKNLAETPTLSETEGIAYSDELLEEIIGMCRKWVRLKTGSLR
jgi:hypothetical protein